MFNIGNSDDQQQAVADFFSNNSSPSEAENILLSEMSFNYENDSSTDSSNGCQVRAQFYEYRGKQVIGFDMDDKHMVCLPQVYDLFLKQLVSGLHTVYTKLKRLNIHPVICNVDQVCGRPYMSFRS